MPVANAVEEPASLAISPPVGPGPQRVPPDHRLAAVAGRPDPVRAAGLGWAPRRYLEGVRESAADTVRAGTRPATRVLIFDGRCGFCTAVAGWAGRRLPRGSGTIPYQKVADPSSYGLTEDQIAGAAYWIDGRGRPHRGHLAAAEVLRAIGGIWGPIGSLLRVPPVSWLAAWMYEVVSRNRHRLPGAIPFCREDDSRR